MPGPGKFFIKVDKPADVIRAWLFNYEVNAADFKPEHKSLLDKVIGPTIRESGTIKLLGLASTTGTDDFNRKLSENRCEKIVQHLRSGFGTKFGVSKSHGIGETMAKAFDAAHLKGGTADNTESDLWRGVVINAWNRSAPPPPPVGLDIPFGNSSWAQDAGAVLDWTALAVTFVDAAADLLEIAAVTAVTGPLGLILGCIQAIVAMPLLFHASDVAANVNGQIQGAAEAVQDMCDQFSSASLRTTPLSKWPAVMVPQPHISSNPQPTANQQAWRGGQVTGLKNAVQKVLNLEKTPQSVVLPSGKHVKISGRVWLWTASQNFKDNCGVELVIKPTNAELAKRGKRPFPTLP